MSKKSRLSLRGYAPAITTPFTKDLELDVKGLGGLLEWLHAEGMHGIFAGGTTGEWSSLTDEERALLYKKTAEQLKGKLPILAGCTSFVPSKTIELANYAKDCGFDAVVVAPPPYIRPNERELYQYYKTLSDNILLPIVVYNWPPGTGIDMSVDLLEQIAHLENIVGIKQSSPHLHRFVETFFRLNDIVRVYGFTMDEHGLTLLQARDGDGTIGAGGVLGRYQPDFYNNLWAGNIEAARECGRKDLQVLSDWYTPDLIGCFGAAPAVMKAGLGMRGVPITRHVRPPLLDVPEADLPAIRKTLVDAGVL